MLKALSICLALALTVCFGCSSKNYGNRLHVDGNTVTAPLGDKGEVVVHVDPKFEFYNVLELKDRKVEAAYYETTKTRKYKISDIDVTFIDESFNPGINPRKILVGCYDGCKTEDSICDARYIDTRGGRCEITINNSMHRYKTTTEVSGYFNIGSTPEECRKWSDFEKYTPEQMDMIDKMVEEFHNSYTCEIK